MFLWKIKLSTVNVQEYFTELVLDKLLTDEDELYHHILDAGLLG